VAKAGDTFAKVPGVNYGVSFFADYRKFMDRGNVIDLAVAVVIGMFFVFISPCYASLYPVCESFI
jgi:hypothetical protein